jgi:hypothetical protein
MYQIKNEAMQDGELATTIAEHKGYCNKFKRIISTQMLDTTAGHGLVVLFAGLTEDDAIATKADVVSFMEEDPFIAKDFVSMWDIIDMTPEKTAAAIKAAEADKAAADALPAVPAAPAADA